jgi:hypothetical protein
MVRIASMLRVPATAQAKTKIYKQFFAIDWKNER